MMLTVLRHRTQILATTITAAGGSEVMVGANRDESTCLPYASIYRSGKHGTRAYIFTHLSSYKMRHNSPSTTVKEANVANP